MIMGSKRKIELLLCFVLVLMNFWESEPNETSLLREMKAECSKDGIHVKLWFKQPFSGVAYSYGHYDKAQCRYIGEEDQLQMPLKIHLKTNYSFLIPAKDCGTEYHETRASPGSSTPRQHFQPHSLTSEQANEMYIENTLLIQKDSTIQEASDLAQRLRCVWRKEIHKPLLASLPFGNVNKKFEPPRINGGVKSEFSSSSSSENSSGKGGSGSGGGRLRFQPKGQVQSVSYNSYRRKSSRSLPITEADRRRDELFAKEEKTVGQAALRLQGSDDSLSVGSGARNLNELVRGVVMVYLMAWMTLW